MIGRSRSEGNDTAEEPKKKRRRRPRLNPQRVEQFWKRIDPAGDVTVRRFAGPSAYVEQFDEPLRVAHVTDLHVGLVTPMDIQAKAAALVNEEKPDVILITGDFVCHTQSWLSELKDVIELYDAPVFAVLGNHDYWSGAQGVRKALLKAGAEVLDNAHTVVELGHQRFQVVGLDDAYTGHADRRQATRGLRNDLPVVGMSHIAEEADALWYARVPLVLSGHTHGGQVTVARLNELAIGKLSGHKYIHGLYGTRNGAARSGAVYVGAGIGAAVMPLRWGERGKREVTFFELGVDPDADHGIDEHHESQEPHPGRKPSEKTKARRRARVIRKNARRERKTRPTEE